MINSSNSKHDHFFVPCALTSRRWKRCVPIFLIRFSR
nr:MAG TPA: hypothetical protein [Caudoviricetes sp.]